MSRIYSIDFLKLIFALLIALGHESASFYLPGEKYAVDFFFVISGFFLARKFYSKLKLSKEEVEKYNRGGGYNYTKEHIKQLYPHYLFSLIILILYIVIRNIFYAIKANPLAISYEGMLSKIYDTLPEFFMLQNSGFYVGGMNYPLWQVCNMLIVGYFLYTLLVKNEKITTQIICPLSIILIYTWLYSGNIDWFGRVGPIYIPLIRTLAPMSLGIILYKFTMSEDYKNLVNKNNGVLLNTFSVLSFIILFLYDRKGYVCLILFTFLILGLFNEKSWINKILNRKIFKSFGNLSYSVYLNHALIIYFVNDLYDVLGRHFGFSLYKWQFDILYVIILLIYSIATMNIIKVINDKKRQKLKEQ